MPLPVGIEGRVASLSDLMDTEVDIGEGAVTIDVIRVNNTAIHIGQETGVSTSTLTTVTTMPANGIKYITKIVCSGEDNARWELYLDSTLTATKRTTDRNVEFDFPIPWKILATQVMDVKVIYFGTGTSTTFDATIWGYTDT